MKKIHLGGSGDLMATVSDEDYERISAHHWYVQRSNRGRLYAKREKMENWKRRTIFMHHEVFGARVRVDHVNGDGLDNRRENLRPCSQRQNNQNARKRSGEKSSRFKGVHRISNGRWRVQVRAGSARIHVGYFDTEEAAAKAYDDAASRLFGKFARTNEALGIG